MRFASRVRNRADLDAYDNDGRLMEAEGMLRAAGLDVTGAGSEASSSSAGLDSETVILSLKERVQWLEQRLLEKVDLVNEHAEASVHLLVIGTLW